MLESLYESHPTKYWHQLSDGRVQCDVCPRNCKLKEGQRGFCFVRARENNQIVLTSYNRSTGFCIDPIEKKPLNHFFPGSSVLSFGTSGCNLGCLFCQNWDISKSREIAILSSYATPEDIANAAQQYHCKSVAFTYNDPVVFMEYAIDTAKACHKLGIKAVAVTNGYMSPDARNEFYSFMDAANVDLKGFTEDFYQKITSSHLQPVLDTLVYLKKETNVWLEITTLLIPGKNDSVEEIENLTQWIVKNLGPTVPLHFSAFYPAWKMMEVPATPVTTLIRSREIALKNGLYHVYTGNVYDPVGAATYCSSCHNQLIERDQYRVDKYYLDEDANCKFCGAKCEGHFNTKPGSWLGGSKPIMIQSSLDPIKKGKQHG